MMFNCVFVTFPYSILGQVWYLIALIPDICRLSYFNHLIHCLLNIIKVRKKAKIRNQYNQLPHLLQDIIWESDKNKRKHDSQEGQEVSPLFQQVITMLQGIDKIA